MSVEWLSSLVFTPEPVPELSLGEQLLYAAPSLSIQLALLVIHATVLYFAVDALGAYVILPWAIKQPWIARVISRHQTFLSAFHTGLDRTSSLAGAVNMITVGCFNGIGGLLCLPAVLGLWPDSLALVQGLACHGALMNAGWKLQNIAVRAYGAMNGRKKKSPSLRFIILGAGHGMDLIMVITMNLYCRENAHYHEFVLLLQGAAATAALLQQVGYILDVRTKDGLNQVKASIGVVSAAMLYCGVRLVYSTYELALGHIPEQEEGLVYTLLFLVVRVNLVVSAVSHLRLVRAAFRRLLEAVTEKPVAEMKDMKAEKPAPARANTAPRARAIRFPPTRAKSPASTDRAAKSMPARSARSPARSASPARSSRRSSSPASKLKYQ